MNKWKILDYVQAGMLARHKDWRAGQALFNAILLIDQQLGDEITGSDIDPFYKNENIHQCLAFVHDKWHSN